METTGNQEQFITKYENLLAFELRQDGLQVIQQFTLDTLGHPWPLRPFDIAIPDWKLIIEIDGRQHQEDPIQMKMDKFRKRCVHQVGWRILHFKNSDVYEKPAKVCEIIRRYRPEGVRGIPVLSIASY